MKQMDIVAKKIADDTIKEIYKDCDWQVGQFLPEEAEGTLNKLDVTTNKYYDE